MIDSQKPAPAEMIHIRLRTQDKLVEFEHAAGGLELGRGPQRQLPRWIVEDPYVSWDQLVVEPVGEGRLRIENLSEHVPIEMAGESPIEVGGVREVALPVELEFGQTRMEISAEKFAPRGPGRTLTPGQFDPREPPSLRELGSSPDPATLARWFETVICVQQAAASSAEFYDETARAVVTLVGLDRGLVLLREGEDWSVAAHHLGDRAAGSELGGRAPEFSRRVLQEMLDTGRTYYQTLGTAPVTASLTNIEAVVAAPIFDRDRRVVGAVYGSRARGADFRTIDSDARDVGITALEAQIIQVLAAAVGAGLERVRQQADAMRSQLQFEQFFSSKLARELARDRNLLEGRQQEVTIVFTDVRDFSLISEHLGPRETFRMMQQVMDLQTSIIHTLDGVVVDYVGDGLLAMWNAPTEQPDHAKQACRAVLEILRQLPQLNTQWSPSLNRPLQLGVGINTGTALVGNTGSRVKFKYGPMGSAVNLASRIEGATKQLATPVLMSESTHVLLGETFATRRLCRASLPGIADPVELYEMSVGENSAPWQQRRIAFETALEHFHAKRWAEACLALYPLISDAHGEYDIASLQLLSRAVECLKSNPDPFDPVVAVRSK
jgi:adenylate cyclase